MTETVTTAAAPEQAPSQKELNFRKQEMMYQRQLEQERQARLQAEREAQELKARMQQPQEEDDANPDPYVDDKRLDKKLNKFGQKQKQETQSEIQKAVQVAIEKERQQNWLSQNKDYNDVMQHADKFYEHDPELAETILSMPEGFERHKLVYKNIKALGLHKPKEKEPSIQEKIDANRRSPSYQPTAVGSAPYTSQSDFSAKGQKDAYAKMQELKSRLRI